MVIMATEGLAILAMTVLNISILVFGVLMFIFWILMLIDCVKRDFEISNDKVMWILLIVLLGALGAIIYYFVVKIKEKKQEAKTMGKDKTVAIILSVLLGSFGVDRFYLGYIGTGILKLITLGGFGIWWLIDLIFIITGRLKPKNGEYEN